MKKHFLTYSAVLLFATHAAAEGPHWSYSGETGPDNWSKLSVEYSACAGKNQSPINLYRFIQAELALISFNYSPTRSKSIINNGHTIQINYTPGGTIIVDNSPFELRQIHFHAPSENWIDGKSYPLEGHLVHRNSNNEYTVIALMFEEGEENPALKQAWASMPDNINIENALSQQVDIERFFPLNRDYYRFNGSLTTPPCTEGVRWLVMKHPVTASKEQIDAFKAVMHHPNNRPIQPANARIVLQ